MAEGHPLPERGGVSSRDKAILHFGKDLLRGHKGAGLDPVSLFVLKLLAPAILLI